jgi:hypothetical protein
MSEATVTGKGQVTIPECRSPMMPGLATNVLVRIADVDKSADVDKVEDKPVRGLPEARKRPRAFGAPSIAEFLATISRHRDSSKEPKPRRSRAKK